MIARPRSRALLPRQDESLRIARRRCRALVTMEKTMMQRILGAAFALVILSACGGSVDSTSSTQNALSSSSSATTDAGTSVDVEGCLTTYATCVRAGTDEKTCRDGLRACLPPPPDHHHHGGPGDDGPRGGPRGGGDCDKDGPPPPSGSAPPPPPGGDGDGPDRDGPEHDGPDGDRPPPPCFGDLDACAKGTDPIQSCVDSVVACLAALPQGGPRRGGR
jgi:hypothetical protein